MPLKYREGRGLIEISKYFYCKSLVDNLEETYSDESSILSLENSEPENDNTEFEHK